MNELLKLERGKLFNSVYLTELINLHRAEEGNRAELLHKSVLTKIENEFLEEISLQKILPSFYLAGNGKNEKCYELTFEDSLQLLMSESKLVRKRVIHVLKAQDEQIKGLILEKTQLELKVAQLELKAAQDKLETSLAEQSSNMETLKCLFDSTRGYKPNIMPVKSQIVANYERMQAYLEDRSQVCLEELWVEALGISKDSFDRYARGMLIRILEEMPHWDKSSHEANFAKYGKQIYWYRV